MVARDDSVDDDAADPEDSRPTRTQQKRAATAVKQLGLQLTQLSTRDLDRLELPERLREEIEVSRRLKFRSRGRQNRLIGRLLRAEDHEAIRKRIGSVTSGRHDGVQQEQEKDTERWLNRLVEEGDSAVEALITAYPEADRQRLRSLARSASQGPAENKAKRARRELLHAIRALRA